jgi:manganese transport protein
MALVALVAACFIFLLTVSRPDWGEVAVGFIPSTGLLRDNAELYLAMAVIGATV